MLYCNIIVRGAAGVAGGGAAGPGPAAACPAAGIHDIYIYIYI